MTSINRQWKSFCSIFNELDVSTIDAKHFYSAISSWLIKNRKMFDDDVWKIYGLGKLSELNPSLYKVECLEGSVAESIDRWNNTQPSSQNSIAIIIRDALWDMAAFKTNIQCPNCQDDDLRALLEPDSKEIILSCDLCCWSQSSSGNEWSGSQNLIPANKDQLTVLVQNIR